MVGRYTYAHIRSCATQFYIKEYSVTELLPPNSGKRNTQQHSSLTTADTYVHAFDVIPFYTYVGLAHQLSPKRQMVVVGALSVLLLEGWFQRVQHLCLLVQAQIV